MTSISHQSFASRLGNAVKLSIALNDYTDYVAPKPLVSKAALDTAIADINLLMNKYTDIKNEYRVAVKKRTNLFDDDTNSIAKLLSPIGTFIQALKGVESIAYQEISTKIKHIRGAVSQKKTTSQNTTVAQVSQVESTFTSKASDFGQIITILKTLGAEYQPPNTEITIAALDAKYQEALNANQAVDTQLGTYKPIIKDRQDSFQALHEQCQDIKNFISAQYGNSSQQYIRIKSLLI
mgnify:CR=1 FL=1